MYPHESFNNGSVQSPRPARGASIRRLALLSCALLAGALCLFEAAPAKAQATAGVIFNPTSIRLDEGAMTTFTVRLATQPSATVDLRLNSRTVNTSDNYDEKLTVVAENDPNGGAALQFTTSNWDTPQTVTLTAKTDADSNHDELHLLYSISGDTDYAGLPEAARTFKVLVVDTDGSPFPTATLEATPNPVAEGSPLTVTVSLSAQVSNNATDIPITVTRGTAEAADIGTLTSIRIAAGASSGTGTLTTAQDDNDFEDETFTISLGTLPSTIIRGAPASVDVVIEDNDTPPDPGDPATPGVPTVSLLASPNPVEEGSSLTVTATLSEALEPAAAAVIPITLAPGTADTTDYSALTSITIAAGSTSQTATITIASDTDKKDNETFTISLGTLPAGVQAGSRSSVVVTIDDDDPTALTLLPESPRVSPGGTVVVTAMLDEMPQSQAATVTITVAGTAPASDYTITPSHPISLTIPTTKRSSEVTIVVTPEATAGNTIVLTATTTINGVNFNESLVITIVGDLEQVHEAVLPEVARAVAGQVGNAISARVRTTLNGERQGTTASLGGESTLAGALVTHAPNLMNGHRPARDLLRDADFVLPLNGDGSSGGGSSSLSLWGSGKYTSLNGENAGQEFDGSVQGVQLGADTKLREDRLAGLALSWSRGAFDYDSDDGKNGDYEIDLLSLHPYFGGRTERMDWWATAGYGTGEVEASPDNGVASTNDATLWTMSAGGNSQVWADESVAILRLKGEVMQTQMEVEESAEMDSLTVDATLIRIALEASRRQTLTSHKSLSPSLSLGVRHDGGDGNTGTGVEMSGNVHYDNPLTKVSASVSMHTLLGRSDYEEWGIQGIVRLSAGADGQGLSFVMHPGYGNRAGGGAGSGQIWSNGLRENAAARDASGKLEMRLGYGLSAPAGRDGLLTPWSGMTLDGDGRRYRLGLDWKPAGPFSARLHGERRERENADADHLLLLKGEMRF